MSLVVEEKDYGERKSSYFGKLVKLLDEYPKILLVGADNVGSNQMQKIRNSLRGKAVILMGKNTMIRKAIRKHLETVPALDALLPHVKGNIGFVFTKDDLQVVKKLLEDNKVDAVAKAGSIAPNEVIVPAGNTGMEPTQTSFLQALGIPSKIAKGTVEITQPVNLLAKGQKVGPSHAALLGKLNIKPFKYGLTLITIYDNGTVYPAEILNIDPEQIVRSFASGVKKVACLSLAANFPTTASLPHSLARGYKNILAIGLGLKDYDFPALKKIKDILANPGAFAAAAPAPAATGGKGPAPEPEKKAPPPKEPSEEEDMGLGLFD